MKRLAISAVFVVACAARVPVMAQEKASPSPAATARAAAPPVRPADVSDYRVGPHDVLEIRVYGQDDLSRTTEVTSKGKIGMPLVNEVEVAGLTAAQIEARLVALYGKDFLVNPEVFVTVKEFRSQQIQVLGAVRSPGIATLSRPSTVLDVLSLVGSTTDAAGKTLLLLRGGMDKATEPVVVDMHRLLVDGDTSENLEVHGGDIVFVPKADEVYILGEVKNPGALKYEEGMTLTQAIARMNGPTRNARLGSVQVVRVEGDKKSRLDVNYNRVESGKDPDFVLKPRDLVIVPEGYL